MSVLEEEEIELSSKIEGKDVEDLTELIYEPVSPSENRGLVQRVGFWLGIFGSIIVLIITSLNNGGKVSRPAGAGGCMVIVVCWWLSEAVPIAVTGLVPVAIMPLFGASSGKNVASAYFSEPIMLFFGSVLVASAVERHGLHTKLAKTLTRNAKSESGVIAAILVSTVLCSAVVSNTTTTAMMSPLVKALTKHSSIPMKKASALSVCYGAAIGGLSTLTGTGVNLAYQAITDISFISWSAQAAPIALVAAVALWFLLIAWFRIPVTSSSRYDTRKNSRQPRNQEKEEDDRDEDDSFALTNVSWSRAEVIVLLDLCLMVLLWLTRKSINGGWSSLLRDGYATDGTVAICAALCLMLSPGDVLPWHETIRTFPWDAFFLLAGGVALATAVNDSGLDALLARRVLTKVHRHWQLTAAVGAALCTSNFVSNVAAANLLLPLLAAENEDKYSDTHRDRILLLVTLACSFAFLFPISTPPNAIVFAATPELTTRDLLHVGTIFTLLCLLILILALVIYL
mmetsp:Transcript_1538/g.2293  ORF Transcript_1538/g.2293 Transcript_1538/m.2293 type:complete len:513 (-) Transcript_1538:82-1620(-)